MKQRLIDANALRYRMGVNQDDKQIFYVTGEDIDAAPTIDLENLRPHGEWVVFQIDNYSNCAIFGCSQCKTAAGIITRPTWRFCPHCGAKMEN